MNKLMKNMELIISIVFSKKMPVLHEPTIAGSRNYTIQKHMTHNNHKFSYLKDVYIQFVW